MGLDEEVGGVGGSCDGMLMPRLPGLSPPLKASNEGGQTKTCRSDTPDSAVDVQSAADSPNSTSSDFNIDISAFALQTKKDSGQTEDQVDFKFRKIKLDWPLVNFAI